MNFGRMLNEPHDRRRGTSKRIIALRHSPATACSKVRSLTQGSSASSNFETILHLYCQTDPRCLRVSTPCRQATSPVGAHKLTTSGVKVYCSMLLIPTPFCRCTPLPPGRKATWYRASACRTSPHTQTGMQPLLVRQPLRPLIFHVVRPFPLPLANTIRMACKSSTQWSSLAMAIGTLLAPRATHFLPEPRCSILGRGPCSQVGTMVQ